MRHILAIPLLALTAFLLYSQYSPTLARADEPSDPLFACTCDGHDKMASTTPFNIEGMYNLMPHEAITKHDVKLHGTHNYRLLASKEIGAHVKVHKLRILGVTPNKTPTVDERHMRHTSLMRTDDHVYFERYLAHFDDYLAPAFSSFDVLRDAQARHYLQC